MIFASLTVERSPLQWADVPGGLVAWITVGGGFATLFLAIWLLYYYLLGRGSSTPGQSKQASWFSLALVVAVLSYGAGVVASYLSRSEAASAGAQGRPGGALHTLA